MKRVGLFLLLWLACAFAFVPPMIKAEADGPIALVIIVVFGGLGTLQTFLFWILFLMAADSLTEHLELPQASMTFVALVGIAIIADITLRFGFDLARITQPSASGPSALAVRYIPLLTASGVALLNRTLARLASI